MFESWPFTNFHDLNLDWIIKTIKTYTKKVDDLYNFGLYDYVEKVLAAHPEWTTTVMDGAITKIKINNSFLKEILNGYVTPEQFGAVGDGVTDDTEAFQRAVDYLIESHNGGGNLVLINKYNIAGTIYLSKGNTQTGGLFRSRSTLSFYGFKAAELYKENEGFMFSALRQSSDFSFINIRFSGNHDPDDAEYTKTNVFDCSRLIRIKTFGCHYSNLNNVFDDSATTSNDTNQQSNKSFGDTFTFCHAAYFARRLYDCSLDGAIIEECNYGFLADENYSGTINNLHLKDCCIESTEGAIYIPSNESSMSVVQLLVNGCYFEDNGENHINIETSYNYGVKIQDNYFALAKSSGTENAIRGNVRNNTWSVCENTVATSNNSAMLLNVIDVEDNNSLITFENNHFTGAAGTGSNLLDNTLDSIRTTGVVKYTSSSSAHITDANYPYIISASGSAVITAEDTVANLPESAGVLYWFTSMPKNKGCVEFFTSSTTKAAYTREMRNNTWSGWRFLGGPLTWYQSGIKNGDTINLPAPAPENSVLQFVPRLTSGGNINRFYPTNIISKGATTATFYCFDTSGAGSSTEQQGVFMLTPYNY